MTNGSDFSRYAKNKSGYIAGTSICVFVVGILVCFAGLVTTAACQKIYGEIYWNPPDLLMVMMDFGNGSSKARAGVFFLSLGFGLPVGSVSNNSARLLTRIVRLCSRILSAMPLQVFDLVLNGKAWR